MSFFILMFLGCQSLKWILVMDRFNVMYVFQYFYLKDFLGGQTLKIGNQLDIRIWKKQNVVKSIMEEGVILAFTWLSFMEEGVILAFTWLS